MKNLYDTKVKVYATFKNPFLMIGWPKKCQNVTLKGGTPRGTTFDYERIVCLFWLVASFDLYFQIRLLSLGWPSSPFWMCQPPLPAAPSAQIELSVQNKSNKVFFLQGWGAGAAQVFVLEKPETEQLQQKKESGVARSQSRKIMFCTSSSWKIKGIKKLLIYYFSLAKIGGLKVNFLLYFAVIH